MLLSLLLINLLAMTTQQVFGAYLGVSFMSPPAAADTRFKAEPWLIDFTVTNLKADIDISFAHYNTPFDVFTPCRFFTVRDITGTRKLELDFKGPIAKRPLSAQQDQTTLTRLSSSTVQVDLSKCFEFEGGHTYEVVVNSIELPSVLSQEQFQQERKTLTLSSSLATVFTSSKYSHPNPRKRNSRQNRNLLEVSYNGCSVERTEIVELAIAGAMAAVNTSLNGNLLQSCATDDYTEFFGIYDATRYSQVVETYTLMEDVLADRGFNFDCTDEDPSLYAYVYASDPDLTIYLAGVFWQAPADLQIDSQPGI